VKKIRLRSVYGVDPTELRRFTPYDQQRYSVLLLLFFFFLLNPLRNKTNLRYSINRRDEFQKNRRRVTTSPIYGLGFVSKSIGIDERNDLRDTLFIRNGNVSAYA